MGPLKPMEERSGAAAKGLQTPAVTNDHRITYISWAESCSRSDHTARELGGRSHMVYLSRFGSRASTVLLKYAGQWILTGRISPP